MKNNKTAYKFELAKRLIKHFAKLFANFEVCALMEYSAINQLLQKAETHLW